MQRVMDAIRFIMHKHGFHIFNYIDDLIGCDKPTKGFKFIKQLIQGLGLEVSADKLYVPQVPVPCLGIDVNVLTCIISIPQEKLSNVV